MARRAELERLLYFNDNQHRVEGQLREALHRYGGAPTMILDAPFIRFAVPQVPSVQTLYAMDESKAPSSIAGVALYTREDTETLSLLFLAVHEEYANGGAREGEGLAPQILDVLRTSATRTKGIRWLRLAYHPKDLRIAIRK